jgi:hypothetical protein
MKSQSQCKQRKKREKGWSRGIRKGILTWGERGYSACIGDEYIQLPKVPKHVLHSAPHALDIAYIRSEHEHIRARHCSNDQVPRLVESLPAARYDGNRSAGTRVLQRCLAPNAARCARDEDDFSAVEPRGI